MMGTFVADHAARPAGCFQALGSKDPGLLCPLPVGPRCGPVKCRHAVVFSHITDSRAG